MSSEPLILGSAHRLKGENLHVLIDDIEGHLSNASAGLAKFKVDIILYDAVLNDKVINSLSLAKAAIAEFRLQASQGARQDRALSQKISAEYDKALDRLESDQREAELLCREAGVIGGDELSRKKASVAAIKKARQIQAASQESLRNSVRTVEQTQHTAAVAAGLIRGQTEQLKDIYAGASGLDEGLRTSNRLLTQMARRACQDRVTACLSVVLALCIIAAV
eukprot:CAMPEP_0172185370 /NCGR_PEP_ID=MMETSP1050-20130122/20128_1 /TAXON_ID=233186 /ORGANISM="Cryptomonas curvata, Strain CCAP979/52" /LENGTH=221 /DNA_ID=CAMNT_0012859341 /DNA_START=48 /DNA_END=710 /DNA_ORIENTATION=-